VSAPLLDDMRWKDYVLARGKAEFGAFWKAHATEKGRNLLFIVGCGFDPRAPMGLLEVRNAAPKCPIDVIGLDYKDEFNTGSTEHRTAAEQNWTKITSAMGSLGVASVREINFRAEDGRRVAARNSADLFADAAELTKYTDVVIDISAMPRVVYFPLVGRLMYFHDELAKAGKSPNIHIIVSEDPNWIP
jgi:hypothetical protein